MGERKNKDKTASDLRRRAESLLRETQGVKGESLKSEEVLRLLHELQVHHMELKIQNEELMQARSELEVLLEKYTGLYDFAPVGYFTLTDDGIIREVNLTGANLLGVDRSHLINRRFDQYVSAATQATLLAFYRNVFEANTKATGEVMLDRDKDDPRHIHIEGTTMESSKGSMGRQCLMVVLDITALKRAEEEKMRLEVQLVQTQKMDSIGTFASGITHDFNNILAAIMGYAELGKVNASVPEKVLKDLTGVIKSSERARDLVRQILSFSRHAEKRSEPLMFFVAVRESLRSFRSMIPDHIEIHEQLNTSGMVTIDQTQIHQIMMNLCSNAIHAMGKDSGILGISLEEIVIAEDDHAMALKLNVIPGPYMKLSISDTGCGMSPELIERIYEPYFTTSPKEGSKGLGLAVVHGIVKKNHGSILCTSTPGAGTTFDIYLPHV